MTTAITPTTPLRAPDALPRRVLNNPVTGLRLVLERTAEDTKGVLLGIHATYPARSPRPPLHQHPVQLEEFEVVSGELTFVVGRATRVLRAGERLIVPPGTPHAAWNASDAPAEARWETYPALTTEHLFTRLTALARAGKVSPAGVPALLERAALAWEYREVMRLTSPAWPLQRLALPLLAFVARALGRKAAV